jgi:ABC-type transport system substrate-binding protein
MNYWQRKELSRRGVLRGGGIGLAGLAGVSLVGCGDDDSSGKSAAPGFNAATSSVPTPAPTSAARRGGKLRLTSANLDYPDIHQGVHVGTQTSAQWAIDTLMTLNEPTPGDFKLAPMLAETLEQPDDQTYVYKLRKGVKFQNVAPVNGREFTAEDAMFSLKRMATNDPRYTRRSWLATVTGYEVLDAYTLRIKTSEPTASLSYLLANPWVGMISKEQVARDGEQLKSHIGTGPYVVDRLDVNNIIQYSRNPTFWGSPSPYFDNVELVSINDPQAATAAFRADEIQEVAVPADTLDAFKKQNTNAQQYRAPSAGIGIVAMNNRRKPYDDVRVRRAIALACDIPGWIQAIVGGQGFLTGPIAPPFTNWALPEAKLKYHAQNLSEAKKLFDAAGINTSSFTVKTLSIGNVPTYIATAVQMQADLKQLGINVQIEAGSQNDYTQRLFVTKDFDVVNGQDFSPDDPDRLFDRLHSQGSGNYAGYANPEVDRLLAQQRRTVNQDERKRLVLSAQETIVDEVPTFYTYVPWAFTFTNRLANWRVSAVTGNNQRWNARNAWLSS